MAFIEHTVYWVKGENFEAWMVALYGVMLVVLAVYFWKFGHSATARALILCHSGQIEQSHLLPSLGPSLSSDSLTKPDPDSFKQVEAAFLMNVLRQNNWNRLEPAHQLGIHKTTLFQKIKSLGLTVPGTPNRSRS